MLLQTVIPFAFGTLWLAYLQEVLKSLSLHVNKSPIEKKFKLKNEGLKKAISP